MKVDIGANSDVGRVRDANEDAFLVHEPFFAVADGMGGHIAGDVASSTAVETIRERSGSARADDMETLAELIRSANARIWEKAQSDPSLKGMGTTCTLLMLDGARAHIAHVGDSRAYLLRNDRLTQLTEDHSLVGRMVKEGRLTAEEAEHHPQRSIITRALGVDPEVEVDLLTVEVAGGDRVLICSDGLSSMIDGDALSLALGEAPSAQAAADRLVELANEAGGEDNVTVVVLDFDSAGGGAGRAGGVDRHETAETALPPEAAPAPPLSSGEMTMAGTAAASTATAAPPREERRRADDIPAPDDRERPPGRTWLRKLVGAVLVVAVLAGATFVGVRYLLANAWYVGVNDAGFVTVYQGIPEQVAGLTFREEVEVSDIEVSELPDFLAGNVEDGIKKDSRAEAERQVAELEERVAPPEKEPRRRRDRSGNNETSQD